MCACVFSSRQLKGTFYLKNFNESAKILTSYSDDIFLFLKAMINLFRAFALFPSVFVFVVVVVVLSYHYFTEASY